MLLQNQSKRKFIIAEGVLNPKDLIEVSQERAEKLSADYSGELVIVSVAIPKEKVKEEIKEDANIENPEKATKIENSEKEKDLSSLTRVDLMDMCDEKGIKYPPNVKKAELVELLQGE